MANSVMASSVVIPQDIIDSIIDVVDYYSLSNCALVSSSFLFPCRKRLFSKISIHPSDIKACQRLHRFLIRNPVTQSFVRQIDVYFYVLKPKPNAALVAILRLPFCHLEDLSIRGWPFNNSNGLQDALSTIVHSPTLKTLYLVYETHVPITFFQGIRLAKLQLVSTSLEIFDREQSRLLTLAGSQMIIDECIWELFDSLYDFDTKPMFLPFMCHLRVFEIRTKSPRMRTTSPRMRTFEILSFLIRSLRLSLTTPATLEHLKVCVAPFGGLAGHVTTGRADVWLSDLDSIITHPAGSRLTRVDIEISSLSKRIQPDITKPILDALPLLGEKGILFVQKVV